MMITLLIIMIAGMRMRMTIIVVVVVATVKIKEMGEGKRTIMRMSVKNISMRSQRSAVGSAGRRKKDIEWQRSAKPIRRTSLSIRVGWTNMFLLMLGATVVVYRHNIPIVLQ